MASFVRYVSKAVGALLKTDKIRVSFERFLKKLPSLQQEQNSIVWIVNSDISLFSFN